MQKGYGVIFNHGMQLGCITTPNGRYKVMDMQEMIDYVKSTNNPFLEKKINCIIADDLRMKEQAREIAEMIMNKNPDLSSDEFLFMANELFDNGDISYIDEDI